MKLLLTLGVILLLQVQLILAQNLSKVEGKVFDSKTNEPLPFASIYLAKTNIGVSANENGAFGLSKIPPGKYDFVVSMLGYKSSVRPMLFDGKTISNLVIRLEPNAVLLETVTVLGRKSRQNPIDYKEFEKLFLGQTRNSMACKIQNKKDIDVERLGKKIVAKATKPIVIENGALGYRIFYELHEFEADYALNRLVVSGIPRFEEMQATNERQKKKWNKERERAYFGSVSHLLKSMITKKCGANYFEVRNSEGKLLPEETIVIDNKIIYKGVLVISFLYELPEQQFSKSGIQSSNIEVDKPITVYENGYFEDFRDIKFNGYLGWSDRLAELLPLDFQPSHELNRNKTLKDVSYLNK